MASSSKYINRDSATGLLAEVQPITTSAGAGDANKLAQLDSTGRFDSSVMPVGITPDTYNANASGALTAGDMVYVTSGGLIARASAAVAGNAAVGFTLLSVTTGNPAVCYFEGRNTAVTGLTVGSRYYLDATTPGAITATPVTGTGKLHQYVGSAISATSLNFEADDPIVLI